MNYFDMIIWLLTRQYILFFPYASIFRLLNGEKKSPLEALTYLKKLCGHPTLVSKSGTFQAPDVLENTSVEDLLQQSQKLQALLALITALTQAGHRVLIFSQSTRMLDIIQRVLLKVAQMSRIDGSTKERDRQRLVDDFNNPNSRCCCMLLSTKAGGLGLTLTGADRAIIYDPSWNPAEDSQAVDRCYR
jgi:SNF2 family DNA or RNA helicase